MENNEKVLIRAQIERKNTIGAKVAVIIYYALAAQMLVVGLIEGSSKSYEIYWIKWFEIDLYRSKFGIYRFGVFLLLLIYAIYCIVPFIILWISERIAKNTSLLISDSRVVGSYSSFLSKKILEMPIEKVSSITFSRSFADKFRSGYTVGIHSGSGVIKLSFVQNAQEVVAAAMNRISALNKAKEEKAHEAKVIAQPSTTTTDKLKELLAMKETGLITEEEFTKLKQDILSKM